MDDPTRVQAQALAGLEPVRLEFSYANPRSVRTGAIVSGLLYVALSGWMIVMGLSTHDGGSLTAMGVGLLVICEAIVVSCTTRGRAGGRRKSRYPGHRLVVTRYGLGGRVFEQSFELLEMHDLRSAVYAGGRYRCVWPLPRNHRPPLFEASEPICFSYHGCAYSFGGTPMTSDEADAAVDRVVDYCAGLRSRLGITTQADIRTYDRDRVARALENAWDVDVPASALT